MESLHKLRLEKGLSLRQMAALCKVTPKIISNVERGINVPQYETRKALERILGKINWLDTSYFDTTPVESTWDQTERDFRALIHRVASLSNEERIPFIISARKHLRNLLYINLKIKEE